ncbi:MAG: class I SAM-dependent methyltransferase [Gammaproteobacteria bacterium SHHR-1]|uniref:class I SAM-dependent methyltransferase n=1 Tax=Magnetovirga frankeli TaxID=947516 RepID=UPI0012936166|nr:class I SAM-dependent methyltransferase [gamma proteobacterium SS-5]
MTEATLSSLCQRLRLEMPVAYDPIWSAAADFLHLIVEHCLTHRPQHIVECSSGISTLMLAAACRLNGCGQVVSLENGAEFAASTHGQLRAQGLTEQARVIHAPLLPVDIHNKGYEWYDISALPRQPIDMLVIDGPPGFLQPLSRYPALPLLWSYLAQQATLFLDDAARPDEQEIVRLWLEEFPGLQRQEFSSERGCVRLLR